MAVPVRDQQWPGPADALPGSVREVLATGMGVCALVVPSEESGAQRLELDNEDGKIVVGFTWMDRLQRLARCAASGLVR